MILRVKGKYADDNNLIDNRRLTLIFNSLPPEVADEVKRKLIVGMREKRAKNPNTRHINASI